MDKNNPPRWPLWGPVHIVQDVIDAPGWYSDVIMKPGDDFPCSASTLGQSADRGEWHGNKWDCNLNLFAKGDPHPLPFRIRLGVIEGQRIVRAVVTIVDVEGVTNATRWRTSKKSSSRKNGDLDVNEYWFDGPRDETCYTEVLARSFNGTTEGPYLVRRSDPCSPKTKPQPYHLYKAQREVAPKGWIGQIREWFAKIAQGTPYPTRNSIPIGGDYVALYDLSLGADAQGVYIDGVVEPSLPSMTLRVTVEWATRAG